jgi:hypothetical protein
MKKTITIIVTIVLIGLVTAAYLMHPTAQELVDKYVLGKEEPLPPAPIEPERWVYVLADGTGSTYGTYAIPKVSAQWLAKVLDEMYHVSGGRLYLSHIDKDSRNNEVLYVSVPKQIVPITKPQRRSGEISFEFTKRLKEWESLVLNMQADSIAIAKKYALQKAEFLKGSEELLRTTVYVKSSDNQWTDIIGILNASFVTLQNDRETQAKKYVVGFSDYIQDAPYLKITKLDSIPQDIQLVAVNPVQNSSKKITDSLIEFEHPARVIETMFNAKK